MNELDQCRTEINRIDAEMAHLFEARMKISGDIANYKKTHGLSIHDKAREANLISKNRSIIKNRAVETYYVEFLQNIINLSCAYQSRLMTGLEVAYCGAEGAFAHLAAKKMFPEAELVPYTDFADAYQAVESGWHDCVVLPLENSYAGEVGTVMDMIFSGSLFVNQVIDIDVVHQLQGVEGSTLETVKTVVSHPQALGQCEEFIRRHQLQTRTFSNTALAAKFVKESGDPTVAAIASEVAAEFFGLNILDGAINTSKNNTTRFATFSRAQNRPSAAGKREDENFILVFTVRNEAGALAQTLNIIGSHGFNMRNLRSCPMKGLLWNYFFYVEAEGNINTQNGKDMLQELSAVCAKLRLAGTYYSNNI